MGFEIWKAPKGDLEVAAKTRDIIEAAHKLGIDGIEPQGFVFAWLNGLKVVVETDKDKNIVSLAFVAVGPRWVTSTINAHVLAMGGNRDGLVDFIQIICQSANAESLFFQEEKLLEETEGYNRYVVKEIKVT